jgi:DNA-binding transcriptional LysR family regulator
MIWDSGLQYFYEAASLGSMRLASDRIGVAVSSISRQVAQLESELGVALIERGCRSIRLTEAGRHVFDYHRDQLANREALQNRLRELREIKTGRVDLAVGEGFLGRAFTGIIESFQKRNPGLSVSITAASTSDIVRMVLDDDAHIGMILNTTTEPKIRVRASVVQPLKVVCAPAHPVAAMESVTLEELARHDICLPPKGFRIRQALHGAEKRAHVWLEPKLTTTSIHVMREMAKAGRMVAVLPRVSTFAELEEGSLVARPLLDPDLEHATISLIHRLGRQLDGAPARLLGMLEARLKTWTEEPAGTSPAR